jgi:CheY-like chemotaxis protein
VQVHDESAVLRILVVDDAADNRRLLGRTLRLKLGKALKAGTLGQRFTSVQVDEAEDGDAGIKAITGIPADEAMATGRTGRGWSAEQLAYIRNEVPAGSNSWYHAVTMDAEMPHLSGFASVPLIRAAGYTGPIFGCTGNALPEDQSLFLRAGVDRVFCKPVQVVDVVDALVAHWRKSGLLS